MKIHPYDFKQAIKDALLKKDLRQNLKKTLDLSNQKRDEVIKTIPEWENMREQASHIRADIIDHLHVYLDMFAGQAEKNGMKVLWAPEAEDARKIVLDILTQHAVKTVVKSKSMLSEEISLNPMLLENNINPIETDLGEYIAQVAGQPPSHITAPIIHLSRKNVASILSKKFNFACPDDPEKITRLVRNELRQSFLTAQAGISGVNFGLVRDGAIVIVENEGNARLSTSSPPLHIALMGIERLLPSLDHLPFFLRLLTVSATGQTISNYVSIIRSAARSGDKDGPEHLYLILIDNGRSALLKQKKYRSVLHCIRCGACMTVCPVYARVGGHAYGSVYPGPLGAVLNPLFHSKREFAQLPFGSTLCGACSQICPVKVPLPELLLSLRADIVQSGQKPEWERFLFHAWAFGMGHPGIYRACEKLIRIGQPLVLTKTRGLAIPRWTTTRFFPPLAEKSFHQIYKEQKNAPERTCADKKTRSASREGTE